MCLLERYPKRYLNSHLQTPETFWLCNQVLGIQGTQNISPKLTIPRSSCIHPSTHNQETFGNRLPQPSKTSVIQVMAILPNSPQYWAIGNLSPTTVQKRFSMSAY